MTIRYTITTGPLTNGYIVEINGKVVGVFPTYRKACNAAKGAA